MSSSDSLCAGNLSLCMGVGGHGSMLRDCAPRLRPFRDRARDPYACHCVPLAINQGAPPEALHPKRHLIEYYHWHHNRPRRRSPGFAARGADSFKVLSAICQSGNSSGWKMAAMLDSSWPSSLPRQRRSFPGVSQWPTLSGGAGIGVLPMTHLAARQRPFDHSKVLPTLLFSCANQ